MKNNTSNSHKTVITKNTLSDPTRYLLENNLLVGDILDYGCGKGFDADYLKCDKYDSYYFPNFPTKKYDIIICNYLLSVLSISEEKSIIENIQSLLTNNKSKAYIAVRRDIKNEDITSKGTYQRNVILEYPSLYHLKNKFEIYKIERTILNRKKRKVYKFF